MDALRAFRIPRFHTYKLPFFLFKDEEGAEALVRGYALDQVHAAVPVFPDGTESMKKEQVITQP